MENSDVFGRLVSKILFSSMKELQRFFGLEPHLTVKQKGGTVDAEPGVLSLMEFELVWSMLFKVVEIDLSCDLVEWELLQSAGVVDEHIQVTAGSAGGNGPENEDAFELVVAAF